MSVPDVLMLFYTICLGHALQTPSMVKSIVSAVARMIVTYAFPMLLYLHGTDSHISTAALFCSYFLQSVGMQRHSLISNCF